MSTMKIELDLPEFKEELKIEIVIRKDGEVVVNSAPPVNAKKSEEPDETKPKKKTRGQGNLMDLEI